MPKDEEKGLTKRAKERRKRQGKHSPAGTEYLRYGDKGFEELSKSRQQKIRLEKEVAAMDSKVPKPISVGKLSSAGSSTPLSSKEWHAKHKGGRVSQSSLREYRGYLRGFRGK
jgi:hypothetical protein